MRKSPWNDPETIDVYGKCYFLHGAEKKLCQKYFPEGAFVLDLGCGTGRTTLPLHEMGFRVIGADISVPMLRHMKRRFPYLPGVAANACQLPFPSNAFDGVLFSYNGLSLIYPEQMRLRAIEEMRRVLKSNGTLILSCHNTPGIVLNLLDRSWRTLPERWRALRYWWSSGYVYERRINLHVLYRSAADLIDELEEHGFSWLETLDRHGRYGIDFARWFDPWPYHCFRKRG